MSKLEQTILAVIAELATIVEEIGKAVADRYTQAATRAALAPAHPAKSAI